MRNGYGDGGCSCPSWWSRACTTRTGSWMASVAELWLVAEQDILVLCLSQVKMRIGRRFDTYRLFSDGFGTKRVRSKTLYWVEYSGMFGRVAFNVCDKRLLFLSIVGTEDFSESVFGSWVWSCECRGLLHRLFEDGGRGLGRDWHFRSCFVFRQYITYTGAVIWFYLSELSNEYRFLVGWSGTYPSPGQDMSSAVCAFSQVCSLDIRATLEMFG